ncbi:MAG: amidase family protein [Candidatus Dormiibacterota bacterium]
MQLTIIGAGAIGGTIGAHLIRAGHDVLLCDADAEHVAAINRDGLTIEGPVENFTVRTRAVTPDGLPERLEHTAVAVKTQHTPQAAELLRGRLAPDGYVVSFQNGLNADVLAGAVGRERVILSFVNFGADLMAPGRIMQGNIGTFKVGEPVGPITARVQELVAALPYAQATDNILGYLWGKEAYGAMLFAGAVSDLSIADSLEQERWRPLMLAVAREVLAQSPVRPEGFDGFDPDDLEGSLERLADFNRRSAKSHSGIYRDLMVRKRPTEVGGQLGELRGPLTEHTAAIIRSIERGERTCEVANLELLAALERAERIGRRLAAVVNLVPAPRRAAAGPLLGMPVAVKDLFDVQGLPRGNGNPHAMRSAPASADAAAVASLRAAAADVFATTAMLEYAAGATHPEVPETRNPHDPDRTAGGSSGGSAALVAAGVCAAALGTDTGGSVRIPAAYCGVVGFKPSHLAIGQVGVQPLAPSLDDVGILAADVATARRVFAALASAEPSAQRKRLRLGQIAGQFDSAALEPEVRGCLQEVMLRLRSLGWETVELDGHGLAQLDSLFDPIFMFEAWRVHGDRVQADPGHFGPETLRLLEAAAQVSEASYLEARRRREELLPALNAQLAACDLLITPAVPFVAPATTPPVDTPEGEAEAMFTRVFNVVGAPAITLPCGWTAAGLPVALQVAGAVGSDWQLLSDAAAVESALAFPHQPRPIEQNS